MSDLDLFDFGTDACKLSIEAQVFRFGRQGGNDTCADCGSAVSVDWCSMSALSEQQSQDEQLQSADLHRWAVTLCPTCAGVHRSMGTSVCQVRSLSMDTWSRAMIRRCILCGPNNKSVNRRLLPALSSHILIGASLPLVPESKDHIRDRYIHAKYTDFLFESPHPSLSTLFESPCSNNSTCSTSVDKNVGGGTDRIPELADRFIDYVCLLERGPLLPSANAHELLDARFGGSITSRFPSVDWDKLTELPEALPHFAFAGAFASDGGGFPRLLRTRDTTQSTHIMDSSSIAQCAPSSHIFSFVLTTSNGRKQYGTSLVFWEPVDMLSVLRVQREISAADQLSFDEPVRYWTPCSLCLISHWPFFDAHVRILHQLRRLALSSASLSPHLLHLVFQIPVPPRGFLQVHAKLASLNLCLSRPPPNRIPISQIPTDFLFQSLDADKIIRTVFALLTEQKVLLLSSRPHILTPVAETLCTLIFPFKWHGVYMPILPRALWDYCYAPVPFLAGIILPETGHSEIFEPPEGVFAVWLDENRIEMIGAQQPYWLQSTPKRFQKLLVRLQALVQGVAVQHFHNDLADDSPRPIDARYLKQSQDCSQIVQLPMSQWETDPDLRVMEAAEVTLTMFGLSSQCTGAQSQSTSTSVWCNQEEMGIAMHGFPSHACGGSVKVDIDSVCEAFIRFYSGMIITYRDHLTFGKIVKGDSLNRARSQSVLESLFGSKNPAESVLPTHDFDSLLAETEADEMLEDEQVLSQHTPENLIDKTALMAACTDSMEELLKDLIATQHFSVFVQERWHTHAQLSRHPDMLLAASQASLSASSNISKLESNTDHQQALNSLSPHVATKSVQVGLRPVAGQLPEPVRIEIPLTPRPYWPLHRINAEVLYFDECISAKHNRSVFSRHEDTPFLSDPRFVTRQAFQCHDIESDALALSLNSIGWVRFPRWSELSSSADIFQFECAPLLVPLPASDQFMAGRVFANTAAYLTCLKNMNAHPSTACSGDSLSSAPLSLVVNQLQFNQLVVRAQSLNRRWSCQKLARLLRNTINCILAKFAQPNSSVLMHSQQFHKSRLAILEIQVSVEAMLQHEHFSLSRRAITMFQAMQSAIDSCRDQSKSFQRATHVIDRVGDTGFAVLSSLRARASFLNASAQLRKIQSFASASVSVATLRPQFVQPAPVIAGQNKEIPVQSKLTHAVVALQSRWRGRCQRRLFARTSRTTLQHRLREILALWIQLRVPLIYRACWLRAWPHAQSIISASESIAASNIAWALYLTATLTELQRLKTVAPSSSSSIESERDVVYRYLKQKLSESQKDQLCSVLGIAPHEKQKKQRAVQILFQPGLERASTTFFSQLWSLMSEFEVPRDVPHLCKVEMLLQRVGAVANAFLRK